MFSTTATKYTEVTNTMNQERAHWLVCFTCVTWSVWFTPFIYYILVMIFRLYCSLFTFQFRLCGLENCPWCWSQSRVWTKSFGPNSKVPVNNTLFLIVVFACWFTPINIFCSCLKPESDCDSWGQGRAATLCGLVGSSFCQGNTLSLSRASNCSGVLSAFMHIRCGKQLPHLCQTEVNWRNEDLYNTRKVIQKNNRSFARRYRHWQKQQHCLQQCLHSYCVF